MKKAGELIPDGLNPEQRKVEELRQREKTRSAGKALVAPSPQPAAVAPSQTYQLPLWAEPLRALPNELLRSALFNAKNRRQPRVDLKTVDIAVLFEGKITYRGEELRQDDETVWLQLIHLARVAPINDTAYIEFTPYSFCKAVKWPICEGSYKRLRLCLERMQATALSVQSKRLKKEGVSLSMIPKFWWQEDGKALKKYKVMVAPELVSLFGDVHYTRVEWSQRLALPVGIATWLHGYYASHREPYPLKLETIKRGTGITTVNASRLRQLIETALVELVNVGFLESWNIEGDMVHVKRKATS